MAPETAPPRTPRFVPRVWAQALRDLVQGSFGRAALVAMLGCAAATGVLRALAFALFDIPADFWPMAMMPWFGLSIAGPLGATAVYAVVTRMLRDPVRIYYAFVLGLLALSMAGPVAASTFPGGSAAASAVLATGHVVVAAVSVGTLRVALPPPAPRPTRPSPGPRWRRRGGVSEGGGTEVPGRYRPGA